MAGTIRKWGHNVLPYENPYGEELEPPTSVRGMQELQREQFRKCIYIPRIRVRQQMKSVLEVVKRLILKMERLDPVRVLDRVHEILLHPTHAPYYEVLYTGTLKRLGVTSADFYFAELELAYRKLERPMTPIPPASIGCNIMPREICASLQQEIDFVRDVTPSQDMFRVSFKQPLNLLVSKKIESLS